MPLLTLGHLHLNEIPQVTIPVLDPPPRFSTFTETREINLSNVASASFCRKPRSRDPFDATIKSSLNASLVLRRQHNGIIPGIIASRKLFFFFFLPVRIFLELTINERKKNDQKLEITIFYNLYFFILSKIIQMLIHGNKILLQHLEYRKSIDAFGINLVTRNCHYHGRDLSWNGEQLA